jgi:hypothetical protein
MADAAIIKELAVLGPHAVWVIVIGILIRANGSKDKIIADLASKCIAMAQAANEAIAIAKRAEAANEAD